MSVTTSQNASNMVGGSPYDLVLIATRRVKELTKGNVPFVPAGHSHSDTALREIENGYIGKEYLSKLKSPIEVEKL